MKARERIVRVVTAGSVDDGKSTLIGRLLWDLRFIPQDQYEAVERASKAAGEDRVNLALLTDGLRAEREAKITIDVAHRYFSSPRRHFILADTPGHPQYTRNMVTGASNADVALLLIDVRHGLSQQAKRHAFITSLLQVPNVLVAVNKMDLVGYDEGPLRELEADFRRYAESFGFGRLEFVPVSALEGDNVVECSQKMAWYHGPTVLEFLESIEPAPRSRLPFRLPVQCVIRPNNGPRGYAGEVASGQIRVGDEVKVLPAGISTHVSEILTPGGPVGELSAGMPAVIQLRDELDIGRGDMLVGPEDQPHLVTRFEALVCWMGDAPSTHRSYLFRQTTREVPCVLEQITSGYDIETLRQVEMEQLRTNDIAKICMRTGGPLFVDLFADNSSTGSFIIVDPDSNQTVAAGVVLRSLEPSDDDDLVAQSHADPIVRRRGVVVWLTGLSGAGKSTLAGLLKVSLTTMGIASIQFDGDEVRSGFCNDLGFSEGDRDENIRRVAEAARLVAGQGFVAICSLISPMRRHRDLAKEIIGPDFLEVFVDCSLEEVIRRDPKGLYERALRSDILNFTGISAPYEPPEDPDVYVNTEMTRPTDGLNQIITPLIKRLGASAL